MSDWLSFLKNPPREEQTRIDAILDTPSGRQRVCDLVRHAGKWSFFSFAMDDFVNVEDTSKHSGILFWMPAVEIPQRAA